MTSPTHTVEEIQAVRDRLLNWFLYAALILGFPALVVALYRTFESGWQSRTYFYVTWYVLVAASALSSAFSLRYLPFRTRAIVALGCLLSLGIASLVSWGLLGSGLVVLFTFCVLATVFFDSRGSWISLAIILATLAVVGRLVHTGAVSFSVDVASYAVSSIAWTNKLLTMGLLAGAVVFVLSRMNRYLTNAMTASRSRAAEQEEANRRLAAEFDERQRAQEELRESEARNRATLESIPDLVLRLRNDGTVLDLNTPSSDLLDMPVEQTVGRNVNELPLPEGLAERVERSVTDVLRASQVQTFEYELDGPKGKRDIETRVAPCGADEVLALVRDVTERKNAESERRDLEAQIQNAQKLESLGVLAGGIAHDFNNLLTAILGNTELTLLKLGPESPVAELVRQVRAATLTAADVSRQLLTYSGRGRFTTELLNVNQLVEEMTHLMRISIKKGVALRYDLEPNLRAIEADATQIRQVFMNLLTNASEAIGHRSGTITIATRNVAVARAHPTGEFFAENPPEGGYVAIEVTDTGIGMDAETREKIFDPFFTTKFTGRGLGLAAVLGIVRSHRGAIKVTSRQGKGTSFEILFPTTDGKHRVDSTETDRRISWRASATVLVADDEDNVREIARKILERFGLRVRTAKDGLEAVQSFRDHANEIDVVLLDMTMPLLDGEGAFREIRRLSPAARIILMSGNNEKDALLRIDKNELAGFLQKPFQLHELIGKVRTAVEYRGT
jgi:PAS domain S-box-containing protein